MFLNFLIIIRIYKLYPNTTNGYKSNFYFLVIVSWLLVISVLSPKPLPHSPNKSFFHLGMPETYEANEI